MDDDERRAIRQEYRNAVNMTPKRLERWLDTEESRSAGQRKQGGESVGHASGRKIVALAHKRVADYDAGDYRFMKKVNGYVARHTAQRPRGDVTDSKWRHSLMNWGHDPLKTGRTSG